MSDKVYIQTDCDGNQYWYKGLKFHREDGPAVIMVSGSEIWYRNGKRHREGAPAAIYSDGTECWYRDDKKHRIDGPAWTERIDGVIHYFWYVNDVRIFDFKQLREIAGLTDEQMSMVLLKYHKIHRYDDSGDDDDYAIS